jgi:hypothetical protein
MTILDMMSHIRNSGTQWLTYAIALLAITATWAGYSSLRCIGKPALRLARHKLKVSQP